MDILFLITGIVFAFCAPFVQISSIGSKVALFWAIMALFAVFVLAYTILAVAKSRIAKINFIASNKIIGWNTGFEQKKKTPVVLYGAVIVCGTVLGLYISQNGGNFITSLLASLALTFTSIGWVFMGQKRIQKTLSALPDFVLSHNGMIYCGKAELFDGISHGITNVFSENGTLYITVLKKKKEETVSLEIPDGHREETENFLNDMKEFFNGEEQKET